MTIREMVKAKLIEGGFEGLVGRYCGCKLDDLMTCDCPTPNCEAGWEVLCPMNDDCDCGSFHITTVKPEKVKEDSSKNETC